MSIGIVVGLLAVGLVLWAAAIRNRDAFWAVMGLFVLGVLGYELTRYGIAARLVSSPDGLLVVSGLILFAVVFGLTQALPASRMTRLVYGPTYPEWAFEQQLIEARQPFFDAAQAGDASVEEKASWLQRLTAAPPTHEWAGLRDRLADGDEEWARLAAAGTPADTPSDEWLAWEARTDQVIADWADLRSRFRERGFARVRVGQRVAVGALVLAAVLFVGGSFHIVAFLTSGPPAGRAAVVPDQPPNRSVYLAPLGDVPSGRLEGLAGFYRTRYDLAVEVLPPAPIPASARDATRGQLVAEDVIEAVRTAYTEASNTDAVVIAVTSEDLYIRSRPDWGWAFGLRDDGHLAVVSTARMEAAPGLVGDRLEDTRLRKMVTKDIGVLYFGLDLSPDPTSVLFDNILSVDDLDAMGEDF